MSDELRASICVVLIRLCRMRSQRDERPVKGCTVTTREGRVSKPKAADNPRDL